jgi:hypothetical protein
MLINEELHMYSPGGPLLRDTNQGAASACSQFRGVKKCTDIFHADCLGMWPAGKMKRFEDDI